MLAGVTSRAIRRLQPGNPQAHLAGLGLPAWTSLRAGFFYNNFVPQFASLRAGDALAYPDTCTFAPVDPRDVGRCAAAIAVDGTVDAIKSGEPSCVGFACTTRGPGRAIVNRHHRVVRKDLSRLTAPRFASVPCAHQTAKPPNPPKRQTARVMKRRTLW